MSMKKIILFSISGFILGGFAVFISKNNPIQKRNLASQQEGLQKKYIKSFKQLSKLNRTIEITIEPKTDLPDNDDQEITLRGTILVHQALNQDLNFKWNLPSGVSLVEGQIEDGLAGVQAEQVVFTEITVVGLSKSSQDTKIIHLSADTFINNQPIGGTAVYSSAPEKTMYTSSDTNENKDVTAQSTENLISNKTNATDNNISNEDSQSTSDLEKNEKPISEEELIKRRSGLVY